MCPIGVGKPLQQRIELARRLDPRCYVDPTYTELPLAVQYGVALRLIKAS